MDGYWKNLSMEILFAWEMDWIGRIENRKEEEMLILFL